MPPEDCNALIMERSDHQAALDARDRTIAELRDALDAEKTLRAAAQSHARTLRRHVSDLEEQRDRLDADLSRLRSSRADRLAAIANIARTLHQQAGILKQDLARAHAAEILNLLNANP
jgi:chromosome segregation ATPase